MLDFGSRGRVRARALAGLVRVDAALDAPADRRADARHGREGVRDDQHEDPRQLPDVQQDDDDRQQHVTDGHERHHDLREMRDTLDAAEDDEAEQQHDAHGRDQLGVGHRSERGFEDAGAAEGEIGRVADGVRLHRREQQAYGEDGRDGEDPRVPFLAHGLLDVIRRAAAELALVFFLVDLAERRFDVGGCRAEERDDPHPEDGTGAAETDCCGDAGDVAGADAARQRHRQRLE